MLPDLTVPALRRRLPAASLIGGEVGCAGGGGGLVDGLTLSAPVVLAEWDLAVACSDIVKGRSHVVALDPPFRSTHSALLWKGYRQAATVHLLYGRDDRGATERVLRHLVHPRFAMVCLFRALQEGARGVDESLERAAVIACEEARVILDRGRLQRAARILFELGVEQHPPGEAKLDTRSSPTFIAAQAEYEECLRLCRTL